VIFALVMVLAGVAVLAGVGGWFGRPPAVRPVVRVAAEDAGDGQATTTFDGPMVRRRAAIGIHPVKGASRARIAADLAAVAGKAGPLEPATFAVFAKPMLEFMVPEMTFVAPEGVSVQSAEAMMRDHQPAGVAFYVVQPVLVHDVTFAVVPDRSVTPAAVRDTEDAEGILTDVLGRYRTDVQRSGVTVRYFGAVLSDASVESVRAAMARAAGVTADRVQVSPNSPFPGVEMDGGVTLTDDESRGHHH